MDNYKIAYRKPKSNLNYCFETFDKTLFKQEYNRLKRKKCIIVGLVIYGKIN